MGCFEVLVEKIDVAAGHLETGMPENLLKLEDTAAVSEELNGEAAPERVWGELADWLAQLSGNVSQTLRDPEASERFARATQQQLVKHW